MDKIEDKRAAVNIHTGISSQLFAASLVLIGLLLGFVEMREISFVTVKGLIIFVALLLLLSSLIIAGIGLKKIRKNGERGNWSLENIHKLFRLQTAFNIIPIILFFSILLMPDKTTSEQLYEKKTIELAKSKVKYDSLILEQEKLNTKLTIESNSKLDTIIRYLIRNKK